MPINPALILEYPMVQGAKVSFCSIEIGLAGGLLSALPGVKNIGYSDPLEYATVFGTSPEPAGSTRGQLKPDGSIEFYRDQFEAFLDVITIGGTIGYAEKRWPLTVSFTELGAITTRTDELVAVRFHSPDFTGSEGTEALTVKMKMQPMKIRYGTGTGPKTALTDAFAPIRDLIGR